ncbi:MAG: hypothetical protein SFV81_26415 [Pirellulaceae bacterium]|nr:hypothetical protein [Pirellulaceae bacterium]
MFKLRSSARLASKGLWTSPGGKPSARDALLGNPARDRNQG